jgi:hypothetical protein
MITFSFKNKSFSFDRTILSFWMSEPLGVHRINFEDNEQAEAAFDMVTTREDFLDEKEINLLSQMTPKEFAKLFLVSDDGC